MNFAIIFAGGVGTRIKNSDIPKQFIEIDGKPIIIHTLEKFSENIAIDEIVISCVDGWTEYLEKQIEKFNIKKVSNIVCGGSSGHDSIHNALVSVKKKSKMDDIVLICDGVRPMVSESLITNCISECKKFGTAVPVTNSIDSVLESSDNISCDKNYDRKKMYITQAPQGYFFEKIWNAHEEVEKGNIFNPISSADLLIQLGEKVHIFLGSRLNIKVTTPEDIEILRSIFYYRSYKKFVYEEYKFEVGHNTL